MKRWLVLLFALFLPLQSAWAGAVAYCQHETAPATARHFGHHEHVHDASAKGSPNKPVVDTDCGTCHLAGTALLSEVATPDLFVAASASVVPHSRPRLPTALARAPDRPQWPRLA